jgi:hypothetical protein
MCPCAPCYIAFSTFSRVIGSARAQRLRGVYDLSAMSSPPSLYAVELAEAVEKFAISMAARDVRGEGADVD